MNDAFTRRRFVGVSTTAALTGPLAAQAAPAAGGQGRKLKILGISCSPRKGMSTASAVKAALEAAKGADPSIEVELIDLGGLAIAGFSPAPPADDFAAVLPRLQDPAVAGVIIGSPAYFRGPSALCKAFVERCAPLREPRMVLDGKPVGAVATGGFRNGGQELVIDQIHAWMMCFGMVPVGGNPPAFLGGTLLATDNTVAGDELGLATARNTGLRVARFALQLAAAQHAG